MSEDILHFRKSNKGSNSAEKKELKERERKREREEGYHYGNGVCIDTKFFLLFSIVRPTSAPTAKKRFNDMVLVAGCPRVCFDHCDQRCPRRCCGPHPPIKGVGLRPKINDLPLAPKCPKICADVCALECPHRCCGPGSMKRTFIPKPIPRLAYMKNQYAYAQRRNQIPVSRYTNPRRFGLKKRDTTH